MEKDEYDFNGFHLKFEFNDGIMSLSTYSSSYSYPTPLLGVFLMTITIIAVNRLDFVFRTFYSNDYYVFDYFIGFIVFLVFLNLYGYWREKSNPSELIHQVKFTSMSTDSKITSKEDTELIMAQYIGQYVSSERSIFDEINGNKPFVPHKFVEYDLGKWVEKFYPLGIEEFNKACYQIPAILTTKGELVAMIPFSVVYPQNGKTSNTWVLLRLFRNIYVYSPALRYSHMYGKVLGGKSGIFGYL